jgi:beta-glucosidase-like glycosyl hydrolase
VATVAGVLACTRGTGPAACGRFGFWISLDRFDFALQEVSQFVDGLQGETQQGRLLPGSDGHFKTISTIKHFAANNSEVNRLTGSSDMDDRTLREYYTKAFRDVVDQSHPGAVMSAYNELNGTPAPADEYLNDTLLRQTIGFNGYMTSDCDAIFEITNGHHWQPPGWSRPANNTERHALAMAAGEDPSTARRGSMTASATPTRCRPRPARGSRPRATRSTPTTSTPR